MRSPGYAAAPKVGPDPAGPARGGLWEGNTMQVVIEVCQYLAPLQPLLTIGSVVVGAANLTVGILRMRRARYKK